MPPSATSKLLPPFPFKKTTSEPILPLPNIRPDHFVSALAPDESNGKVPRDNLQSGRTRRPTDASSSASGLTRNSFFQGLRKKQEEQQKEQTYGRLNGEVNEEIQESYEQAITQKILPTNIIPVSVNVTNNMQSPPSPDINHGIEYGSPQATSPLRNLLVSQEDEERLLRSLGWSPSDDSEEVDDWISEEEKEAIRQQVLQNRLKIIQTRKSRELSLNSSISKWQKRLFFSEQLPPENESSSSETEE